MIRRPPRSTLSSSSAASDVYKRQVWDAKLAAYLLDASASKYNLSELIIRYRADAAFTCEAWPDAGALADLFAKMKAEITALGEDALYNDIEFPLAQVLADMTRIGILVDREGIEKFGVKMRAELEDCLLYTSPSPRDGLLSRMPSSA